MKHLRFRFKVFDEERWEGWIKKEKVTFWMRIKSKGPFEKIFEKKVVEVEDSGAVGRKKFEVNSKEVRYIFRKREWDLEHRSGG